MRTHGLLIGSLIPAASLILALLPPAQAEAFPGDSEWIPLTQDGVPIGDPPNDYPDNGRDIVGDMTMPAVEIFSDGVNWYFRLRLDGTPLNREKLFRYSWGMLIDTNADPVTYEFILRVNGSSGDVELAQNTVQNGLGGPQDPAEILLSAYPINLMPDGNVRVTLADSSFNNTADHFLDVAFPLADLTAAGITETTPLILIGGTGSNGLFLEKDIAGTGDAPGSGTLPDAGSDPTYPGGTPYVPTCGDGLIWIPETCDDGNAVSGDGCSETCTVEDGYVCTGQPSVCSPDSNPDSPEEPGDPTDPTDPENPEDPTDPENPEDPTDPENPEDPTDPMDPTDPENPESPDNPEAPQAPENPTEPEGAIPSDSDGDGVANDVDNCPGISNTSQSNLDGDDVGDECDRDSNGDGLFDDIGVSGGGCSASGTPSDSALILGMLLVLPLWRRRLARGLARLGMHRAAV